MPFLSGSHSKQRGAAISREEAQKYAHDAEYLACQQFLQHVDVTLLAGGIEYRAVRYSVSEKAGELTNSRPGGVLWPTIAGGWVRIVLSYSLDYTAAKKEAAKKHLKINWGPTDADISHACLAAGNGRNYVSSAYALQRADFSK